MIGDGDGFYNLGNPFHLDRDECPRILHVHILAAKASNLT
jgi:hypothetical protein